MDVSSALQGRGQALEPSTRAFMESHLRHDFRDVRVHTDAAAAASANKMNARAYTFGREIVFASGEYAPTAAGLRLLAHELSHVVQQSGGVPLVQCDQRSKSPAAKPADPITSLSAKAAEVQRKLQWYSDLKDWRGQFHADTAEEMKKISELEDEWAEANAELRKIGDEWYVFEHASFRSTQKRIDELWKRLANEYWRVRHGSEAEQSYEAKVGKREVALLAEQRAIVAEISKLRARGGSGAQDQYESLMARLNRLSTAVDQLWDEEVRMQAKYMGPVSRPSKAGAK